MVEPTLLLAFVAGLISFISPCVLPLVPAYVGYMGGRMTHSVAATVQGSGSAAASRHARLVTVTHSLFFVAGFTFIFVSFGLLGTTFVNIIGGDNLSAVTNLIGRLGGVLIIFFGLHFMGVLPRWLNRVRQNEPLIQNPLTAVAFALAGSALLLWGFSGYVTIWDSPLWGNAPWAPIAGLIVLAAFLLWLLLDGAFTATARFWRNLIDRINRLLYADTRREMQMNGNGGYSSSAIMGVVFSAGWTPCIGPVYGAVLTMAANGGDIGQAGFLLAAYSLGLGIPFVLTALALDSAQGILRRLQRHMHTIELAAGTFLVIIGFAVASGQLQRLSQQFSIGEFAEFAISVEENVLDTITGQNDANTEAEPVVTASASDSDTGVEIQPTSAASSDDNDLMVINPNSGLSPRTNTNEPTNAPPSTAAEGDRVELSSITSLAASSSPAVGIAEGNIAPDFETVTVTGQPIRLSDFRGQVVLLNFWATWCGPCRIEMPEFEAAYNARKDDGFTVVAVNNQESVAAVQQFRDDLDLTFPMLMDEQADIQNRYAVDRYPITFLIGRDGTILKRHFGPITPDQLEALLKQGLAS